MKSSIKNNNCRKVKCKISCLAIVILLLIHLTSCTKINTILSRFNIKSTASVIATMSVATPSNVKFDELVEIENAYTLSKYPLPKKEEVLNGFKVIGIYDYDERNARLAMFEHEKTGMKAILISNNDEDKSFVFAVNTYPNDNKGIPHIFEHATIDSSEKYPRTDSFFDIVQRTYTTYLNACTGLEVTYYPASSLSDEQLFAIYKFYAGGVFKPMILKNENILKKEAARYVLYDKNDDINVTGAVYNEMAGYYWDIGEFENNKTREALYKNGHLGKNPGGDYYQVIDVTHQELIDFHDKYYNPSNMVVYLYGDIDYEKYLKLLDEEYLGEHEKKEDEKIVYDYEKNETFEVVKYDYPVVEGFNVENACRYDYALRLENLKSYDISYIELICQHLNMEDSILKKLIKEKLNGAEVYAKHELGITVPHIIFSFRNVNEEDENIIKEIVELSIQDLVENGVAEDTVNMFVNDNAISKELNKDSHGLARQSELLYKMAEMSFRSKEENNLGYFLYVKGRDECFARYKDGYLDKFIKKYFENRNDGKLVGIIPKPGLFEEMTNAEKQKLVDKKNNSSEEEVNNLITESNNYDEWLKNAKSEEISKDFSVASVSDLEIYKPKKDIYEENYGGIRFIKSSIEETEYSTINLMLDVKTVPFEDLHKLALLANIFTYLPTENYKSFDHLVKMYKECYNYDIYINTLYDYHHKNFSPYFTIKISALDKNYDEIFKLLEERLLITKFEDINVIKTKIPGIIEQMKSRIQYDALDVARSYLGTVLYPINQYEDYINNVSFIKFLDEVVAMNDEELNNLMEDLYNIYVKVLNKNNMICSIVSNTEMSTNIKTNVMNIFENIIDKKLTTYTYEENLATRSNTGVVIDSTVNYNLVGFTNEKENVEYSGKYIVLSAIIDDIMYNEFRAKNGAYGAYITLNENTSYMWTYKDPNVKISYDVYKQLPTIFDNMNLTEEKLENYKLKAYSKISYPLTKHEMASVVINDILKKSDEMTFERKARYMQEIKNTTIEDIKGMSEFVHKLCENGAHVTVGNEELIKSADGCFDEINMDYANLSKNQENIE